MPQITYYELGDKRPIRLKGQNVLITPVGTVCARERNFLEMMQDKLLFEMRGGIPDALGAATLECPLGSDPLRIRQEIKPKLLRMEIPRRTGVVAVIEINFRQYA